MTKFKFETFKKLCYMIMDEIDENFGDTVTIGETEYTAFEIMEAIGRSNRVARYLYEREKEA